MKIENNEIISEVKIVIDNAGAGIPRISKHIITALEIKHGDKIEIRANLKDKKIHIKLIKPSSSILSTPKRKMVVGRKSPRKGNQSKDSHPTGATSHSQTESNLKKEDNTLKQLKEIKVIEIPEKVKPKNKKGFWSRFLGGK